MSDNDQQAPVDLEKIQAELEEYFCPPLETSLVSAFLSELDTPSPDSIVALRLTLEELALQAERLDSLDDLEAMDPSVDLDRLSLKENSQSSQCGSLTKSSGTGYSTPSTANTSSPPSFDTPLGFLQTAFPHLHISFLQRALDHVQPTETGSVHQQGDLDMGLVVESLLNEEFVREEQERTSLSSSDGQAENLEKDWSVVERKGLKTKTRPVSVDSLPPAPTKARKPKAVAVPLVDLLQRQHTPSPRPQIDFTVAPDPWSHLASLASTLAGLVPELNEGRWLALFHNPAYSTPSDAVRAELQRLSLLRPPPPDRSALDHLLELLSSPSPYGQADQASSRRQHDADLCLRACQGRQGDALDLVWLLDDMDAAGAAIVHTAPSAPPLPPPTPPPQGRSQSPRIPQPLCIPPRSVASRAASPSVSAPVSRGASPNPNQWTLVAPRRAPLRDQHPLANAIPAYRTFDPSAGKKKKPTPSFRRDVMIQPAPLLPPGLSELEKCRWWAKELRRQRDEALRAAGRHWQRGSAGERGGEVALHYAEQARQLEDKSREWALKGARLSVQQQRTLHDPNTIDLHGLTLHESLTVVREGVNEWYSSSGSGYAPSRSLTIITGVGKHSANQKSVLGPAVFKALEKDGWQVIKRQGAIVVNGVAR